MDTDVRTTPHRTGMDLDTRGTGTARTLTIIGFVCAVVSLFFAPIIFGVAAIVLGIIAYRKGDPLGMWAAVAGVVGMIAGFAFAAWLLSNANDAQI